MVISTEPSLEVTPALLLRAYAMGVFPMSERAGDSDIFWVDPTKRGIFPLYNFHVSRSLARRIRQAPFEIRINSDFAAVVRACADRPETWINDQIFTLYCALHRMGHAHSVEVRQGTQLVGGLYGVQLGAAFFGESMFSARRDTSKIALTYLMARLRAGGFSLFDAQFLTDHLASLGAIEVPRCRYQQMLRQAVSDQADFWKLPIDTQPSDVLHLSTQTS
jgi:leucyl/phenylalanyl-tRNA---protein transferase